MALRFGLFLTQRAGGNRLVINSDNMGVIEIMQNERKYEGMTTTILMIITIWLVISLSLVSIIVIGKPIGLLMSLRGS